MVIKDKFGNKNVKFINPVVETEKRDAGVWISASYGSGKFHFLSILAYLIQNDMLDRQTSGEYFESKAEDDLTLANLIDAQDI